MLGFSVLFMVIAVAWLILLLPLVFYLLTLQRTLAACSIENRRMQPGLVWLQIVPFFGAIWQFFVVSAIAASLQAEFQKRGIVEEPSPGQSLGLAMCILSLCSIIPFLGVLAVIAGLVCWILYWSKVAGFKAKLTPLAAVA